MRISIKSQLEKIGKTRYQVANEIGVTYPTIDNMYKERSTSIKFDILEKLCAALECTPNDILITGSNQDDPN